ncbi:hypothetical protein Cyan10605_1037 [Cyanobacterium aponinum PCC 10605]|uniref:Uncharacterized protein n=1 Tax=Cyanobacterium aponinum (strain PCC 10605) TaxID=755178 RepID=K9Z461_CYAAP|nr:hypothetical protein Cyan10605_1037 [Cyanobacterium aponinum PCC 10605]
MDDGTKYAIFLVISCLLIIGLLWLPDILRKD